MCGQLPSSCFLAVGFITFCSIHVAMSSVGSATDECDALDCLILVTRLRVSSLMSDGSCEVLVSECSMFCIVEDVLLFLAFLAFVYVRQG